MPATGFAGTLPPDKEQAIIALLREATVPKAAEAIGVDESTLYRWLRDAEFAKVYRDARREAFRHAIGMTQKFAPIAVQALVKIVADQKVTANARVAAAGLLLKFSRESIELDDVVARVEALEQAATLPPPAPGFRGAT